MSNDFEFIDEAEFDQLIGHLRFPTTGLMYEELVWAATSDRSAIGLVVRDKFDRDFAWVYFARCGDGYETIDVDHSLSSVAKALEGIKRRMLEVIQ
jgi:hypothetical protein